MPTQSSSSSRSCATIHIAPLLFACLQLPAPFKGNNAQWHTIFRSREVKQSWFTTVFTSALSLLHAAYVVACVRPELLICNGPGTCVPLCYCAFALRLLGVVSNADIVFVESFCRVQRLSLSGRLLYPVADRFLVQWPQLCGAGSGYGRAEYLGKFGGSEDKDGYGSNENDDDGS
jgi:beta-1,4-N-acetylglucosaminyltransferase